MQKQSKIMLPSVLQRVAISLGLADFIMRETDGKEVTINSSVNSPRHVVVADLDKDTLHLVPEDTTYGILDLGTHGKILVDFPQEVKVEALELKTVKVHSSIELPHHLLDQLVISGAGGEFNIELSSAKRIEISGTGKKGVIQLKNIHSGSRIHVSGVGVELVISIPRGTSVQTTSSGIGNSIPKHQQEGKTQLRLDVEGLKNRIQIEEF